MLSLCPECHMPVSDQAEECPHCGYSLRPESGNRAKAAAPTRVCEYCKMENPGDVMFCVSCGAPLKVAKTVPAQSEAVPAPQPLNSGSSQGAAAAAAQPSPETVASGASVRQQPVKPHIRVTPRTVFNLILLAVQWGICLILTLFAVVLATVPSASAIWLAAAAIFACPLIKKLFRIHPALRALIVFVLFMAAVFTE